MWQISIMELNGANSTLELLSFLDYVAYVNVNVNVTNLKEIK